MIASAGVLILISAFWGSGVVSLADTRWLMVGLFVLCFALLRKTKLNPIAVMVMAGVLNLLASLVLQPL